MTKWMRHPAVLALMLVSVLGGGVLGSQPFSTEVQIAINQLVTGVVPFTAIRAAASSYFNWGTTQGTGGYGLRDNAGSIQVKNSGGAWSDVQTTASTITAAPFITRTLDGNLSNEFALSSLATAILVNTTGTGTPTAYAGTGACAADTYVTALSAIGGATCTAVTASGVSGIVAVANGGTGLTTGTSGGILGYTAAGVIASSALLTQFELVIGGGAGALPTALGSLGSTTTVLHGNAAGAPTFAAVSLTADVSGTLPAANGGTGNAFFGVAGPAASVKVYTFPNATTTVLTTNAAVTAAQGGTGHATYAVGDVLAASAATTLDRVADVATGNALLSGGVGVLPAYGKVGLTTHVSGTLPVTNGGTGLAAYAVGDLVYASGTTTLAGLLDVAVGRYLRSGGANTAPLWSTLVLPNAATQGQVPVASAADTITMLAVGTTGQLLRSAGAAATPVWSTTIFPNAATQGDLMVATAANTYGSVADVAVGQVLASGGAGVVPAYTAAPALTSATFSTFITLGATAFAALPADANGSIRYCNDCTVGAACAGAGLGAIAKRLNGAWTCS